MANRPYRYGFNGQGRSLGYGDAPKVARGEITSAYQVDVRTLTKMQDVFDNEDKRSLMKRPGQGGFRLLEGEMAFKVRGGGNRVLTALNGLDAEIVEVYPDDRELVRDILSMLIQPVGVVREDARTDQDFPQVTLRVGGTCPQGAPNIYNVPGQQAAIITTACAVVYDVPNLSDPVQYGTKAGGRAENKVTLVARAADKTSVARKIQNVLGNLIHDPEKFKRALKEHPGVANSWLHVGLRVVNSFKVSLLMSLDLLLKEDIIRISPNAPELLDADGTTQLTSEDTVARLGELLGVLDQRRVFGSLTTAQRSRWKTLDFNLKQRMVPVPDPQSKTYNAANEFGFVRDVANNTWSSKARVGQTGELRRDPIGKLLELSLTHLPQLLEAFTVATYDERRKEMGVALTSPSLAGTCIFDMMLTPHGGLSDIK